MSLDGYIAGPKGEYDWIVMDPEIDFPKFMARFDTVLLGRKSFEVTQAQGGGAGGMPEMKTYVVSRTLRRKEHPGVTIVGANLKEEIANLRQAPGKEIWLFGGGELFRSLLDLGLVDRVEVAIVPVLLGGGIPFLPAPAARARLTLTGQRIYKTGIVSLEYDVA
jgi:dihydrofolate reductase